MTARFLAASREVGTITLSLDTSGSRPTLHMYLGPVPSDVIIFDGLADLDALIAAACEGRSMLGGAIEVWSRRKAEVALPVRGSMAEFRAELEPTQFDKPQPFVPLVHYITDDETVPCEAQGGPGLTVNVTTDPAGVTCGLCKTSESCREDAASRQPADPFASDLPAPRCVACELDADPGTGPLGHTYLHRCAQGPHCAAEGCGGQDCDCRGDCGHPMCQAADPDAETGFVAAGEPGHPVEAPAQPDDIPQLPADQEEAFGRFEQAHAEQAGAE